MSRPADPAAAGKKKSLKSNHKVSVKHLLVLLSQFVCPALPACPSGFAHLWWQREACFPFDESIGIEISEVKDKQKP